MVRLKAISNNTPASFPVYFNSIMVRLKVKETAAKDGAGSIYFNSIMVRLKVDKD